MLFGHPRRRWEYVGALVAVALRLDPCFPHNSNGAAEWVNTMVTDHSAAEEWVKRVNPELAVPVVVGKRGRQHNTHVEEID